jgi:hypothetical protein
MRNTPVTWGVVLGEHSVEEEHVEEEHVEEEHVEGEP